MALTATINRTGDVLGNLRVVNADINIDATTYTTGGYVLSPALFGLIGIAFGQLSPKTVVALGPGDGSIIPQNNGATFLMKLIAPSGIAEVANAASLTGAVINVTAYGW
jgi:hypothetical protein